MTEMVTEIPRCFSISIQSETACRAFFLALDGARQLDGPAVEQELFGQGGFTRVRVRDDCKCTAFFNFFTQG